MGTPAATGTPFPYTTLFRSRVVSENHVPTAAGLASSASAFSALSIASNTYFNTNLSFKQLCEVTRKGDRKSTRLNSSHVKNSYAVFGLKKKKTDCRIM